MVEQLSSAKNVAANEDPSTLEVERKEIHAAIKNKLNSPFLNRSTEWDDKEKLNIPEDIIKGIKEELKWDYPSRIQSVAIPLIVEVDEEKSYNNLIA